MLLWKCSRNGTQKDDYRPILTQSLGQPQIGKKDKAPDEIQSSG
jgi:hypothetical protein